MRYPENFLLVDDDDTNNILCGFAIRKAFGSVNTQSFTSPTTALAHLRSLSSTARQSRSVLFLDINMPEMTGWEFMEAFSELDESVQQNVTVYMMSSSLDARDREKAAAIPALAGYVPKPLSVERLKTLFGEEEVV